MAGDDFDPMPFTPWNIGSDNPLNDWASNLKPSDLQDFIKAHGMGDASGAIDKMIERGIAPPPQMPESASSYLPNVAPPANPPTMGWGGKPAVPPDSEQAKPPPNTIIRVNPDGTIKGNISDDPWKPGQTVPDTALPKEVIPQGVRQGWPVPIPVARPAGADLNKVEEPVEAALKPPKAEEEEKKPTDVSAEKKEIKPLSPEAVSNFAKSLAGVKALQPPPVNPVGTPSVRSPTSINAPQLNALLALAGQRAQTPIASLAQFLNRGRMG